MGERSRSKDIFNEFAPMKEAYGTERSIGLACGVGGVRGMWLGGL